MNDNMKSTTPLVHVLTYCSHPTSSYGSLMVFDTIRTGFPSAEIEVFDNGSCSVVLPEVEAAAMHVGADFHAMANRHYSDHLRWVLLEREHPAGRPLVLLDPDVVFWRPVEQWDFAPALLAGRLIPAMDRVGIVALPRLHPSLLFVPDVHALREVVKAAEMRSFGWNCIGPRSSWIDGQPYFWDTLADLFNALSANCIAFGEDELDCYDHLFCGTHLQLTAASQDTAMRELYTDAHRFAATGEMKALRGIWRRQQAIFETHMDAPPRLTPEQMRSGMLSALQTMAQWRQEHYTDAELWTSVERVAKSIHLQRSHTENGRGCQ